jgi:hypothetical protein
MASDGTTLTNVSPASQPSARLCNVPVQAQAAG